LYSGRYCYWVSGVKRWPGVYYYSLSSLLLLTFISAAFKVVTSCGCFGDAIPLTPWQSFSKDLILLALIIVIFLKKNLIQPLFTKETTQRNIAIAVTVAIFGFWTIYL
jgi:hypothetical protein